jgi:hypothetical protein
VRPVERRTAVQHLDRLLNAGLAERVDENRFRAT